MTDRKQILYFQQVFISIAVQNVIEIRQVASLMKHAGIWTDTTPHRACVTFMRFAQRTHKNYYTSRGESLDPEFFLAETKCFRLTVSVLKR